MKNEIYKEHENNLIGRELSELDLEIREKYSKAKGWFPLVTYEMVQCGYPYPDHGEMIARSDGGTNEKGELLPSSAMWCKVEDVRNLLKNIISLEGLDETDKQQILWTIEHGKKN